MHRIHHSKSFNQLNHSSDKFVDSRSKLVVKSEEIKKNQHAAGVGRALGKPNTKWIIENNPDEVTKSGHAMAGLFINPYGSQLFTIQGNTVLQSSVSFWEEQNLPLFIVQGQKCIKFTLVYFTSVKLTSVMIKKFDRLLPYNELPLLPPEADIETKKILRKTVSAGRALAHLNGILINLPNPTLFLDTIHLLEAKASSEVENIITTNDELYKYLVADKKGEAPATKEVLCYKEAL